MRKRRVGVALAATLVAGGAIGWWLWPRAPGPDPAVGAGVGGGLAAALGGALDQAERILEPHRCARMDAAPAAPARPLPGGRFEVVGDTLRGPAGPLVAAVVADSRGATPPTLARIAALRAELERAGVQLVISLGGLGTGRDEITAVLGALGKGAPWTMLALPGDRESLAAHDAAIATLAADGMAIVGGGRVRFVDAAGVTLGTFPGVEQPSQLVAGPDGCQHAAADAAALAAALAGRPGTALWAGWAPPRQQGKTASDLGAEGVHVGEPMLAQALAGTRVALVLSAMVDEAAAGDGEAGIGGNRARLHLASGALEAVPGSASSALLLRVDRTRVTWRRLRVD